MRVLTGLVGLNRGSDVWMETYFDVGSTDMTLDEYRGKIIADALAKHPGYGVQKVQVNDMTDLIEKHYMERPSESS